MKIFIKVLILINIQFILLNPSGQNRLFSFPLQDGWPVIIGTDCAASTLTLADLDNNGTTEVIFTSNSSFAPNSGFLYVYSYNGTPFPSFPIDLGRWAGSCAVGDLDEDEDLEIVVIGCPDWEHTYLFAFHHNSSSVDGWPVTDNVSVSNPIIIDIYGDNRPEVLVEVAYFGIVVLNAQGDSIGQLYTNNLGVGMPAAGDIDGNGDIRILAGTGSGVFQFYPNGDVVPNWPLVPIRMFYAPVTMADVDGDSIMEMIAKGSDEDLIRDEIYLWEADGTEIFHKDIGSRGGRYREIVPCNLDADSDLELLFFAKFGSQCGVDALHHNGTSVSGWPQYIIGSPAADDGEANGRPSFKIADIDGDNVSEILTSSNAPGDIFYIYAWEGNGTLCDGFPIIVTEAFGVRPVGGGDIAIADLDGDGDVEIVFISYYPSLSQGIWKTIVYAWDLPGAWNPDVSPWPQFHQGPERIGSIPIGDSPFVTESAVLIQPRHILYQNTPNPFNKATTIQYRLEHSSKVSLKVYNVVGQEVAKVVDAQHPAGYHSVVWEAENISPGVYFYKITAGEFTNVKKCVITK